MKKIKQNNIKFAKEKNFYSTEAFFKINCVFVCGV